MRIFFKKSIVIILSFLTLVPALVFAHQPRLNTQTETTVTDPEISKAYYGKLSGMTHIYRISADAPFDLYVNVLVPDIAGQKKDISAVVIKNGDFADLFGVLNGITYEWQKFFEPFGHDNYWMGPEFRSRAEAGQYEIRVFSTDNDSKYSLAIGETESFNLKESINALNLIPQLKRDFFNESPISFILSPFGLGYILIMYILAFVAGLVFRVIMKKAAKDSPRGISKNIGRPDRLIRAAIGAALLFWAITTSWNPILLFFSGFLFFESIFSWCGLYAAIGKNTRPSEPVS